MAKQALLSIVFGYTSFILSTMAKFSMIMLCVVLTSLKITSGFRSNASKDTNKRTNDSTSANATLPAECENLAAELRDTEDLLKDCENKLANANAALEALRAEMEQRLREKDEEIEAVRNGLCLRWGMVCVPEFTKCCKGLNCACNIWNTPCRCRAQLG